MYKLGKFLFKLLNFKWYELQLGPKSHTRVSWFSHFVYHPYKTKFLIQRDPLESHLSGLQAEASSTNRPSLQVSE